MVRSGGGGGGFPDMSDDGSLDGVEMEMESESSFSGSLELVKRISSSSWRRTKLPSVWGESWFVSDSL